ncbi:putative ribonuclease H-like domain-containing protein [Tanacetum coccineum]
MNVSFIPTTKIDKDHPKDQIIGDLNLAIQTRRMTKISDEHAMVSYINKQRRTNHKDYQNFLFDCFLSQKEPKKVIQALADPSWVEAMQEDLLQFKHQKVWTLVDLPNGKRAIETKWVFKNKKDERGIVARNIARLVAQGFTQEEGIDYDKVFAPVARIEAIRLLLAYASFMGFIMYQMDVKSAFLYGTIEEEVYVCQPPGFEDPHFPNKVYKVEKALYGLHQAPRAWLKLYDVQSSYRSMNRSLIELNSSRPDIMLANFACASFCPTSTTEAKVKTVNGERQLQALVDKKKVIITKTSIRSDLNLEDAGEPMTEKETNEESVPKHSYDLSQSGEDRMQLYELMNLCTKLFDRIFVLETTKTTQALEIANLKGRSIEEIDKDAEVSLVNETEMFDTDALIGDEVFTENDMTEKEHAVIPKEVSTGEILTNAGITIPVCTAEIKTSDAYSTTAVSPPVITEVEITLAQSLAELKKNAKSKVVIQDPVLNTATTAPLKIPKAKRITFRDAGETTTRTPTSVSSSSIKDKGKAKMVEPRIHLKKKDQICLNEYLEDLETFWKLVKAKYGNTRPEDDYERVFWVKYGGVYRDTK